MSLWHRLLQQPGPLLADGAMGTMLMQSGLQFGDPPELWNVFYPDRVRAVHRGYIDAGAQVILTNTFGGSGFRLAMHNLEDRVDELNRTGAIMLRAEVDLSGREVVVAGDIGPSGQILAPLGTLDYAEAVDGFAEQAAALVAGRVDVIWIETMSALEEMEAAIEGVRRASADIPIIATMTFDTRGRTMMGVTPEQAAEKLLGLGVDAIGGNCGNGPEELLPVVEKMAAVAPEAVIVAKSNVGMPQLVDNKAVYLTTPEDMTAYAGEARRLGARVIGACCGSTPDLLEIMAGALR
jgi:5-methyltetrahydrofolate--homocysteine methyltransferase